MSAENFRLLDPVTLAEPCEFWQALREAAPIHRVDEGIGFTIVSRYEDVLTVLRDTDTFSTRLSRKFRGGLSAYEDSPAVKDVLRTVARTSMPSGSARATCTPVTAGWSGVASLPPACAS